MKKIAIVEDHDLLRTSFVNLINEQKGYTVILDACNGDDLIRKLNPKDLPDVILVDVEMPIMDGPATIKALREKFDENIKLLGLSVHKETQLIKEMLRLGANGYITKAASADELFIAIEKVMKIGFYMSKDVARLVDVAKLHKSDTLNELEQRILLLICAEKINKEIAEEIGMSVNTINTYRTRIIDKLGVRNSVGLVLFAIREGFFKVK
jgi:DNA-binding NarL/FixJ family response regulator